MVRLGLACEGKMPIGTIDAGDNVVDVRGVFGECEALQRQREAVTTLTRCVLVSWWRNFPPASADDAPALMGAARAIADLRAELAASFRTCTDRRRRPTIPCGGLWGLLAAEAPPQGPIAISVERETS